MKTASNQPSIIANDPTNQTIVVIFPKPLSHLVLTPQQAEAFAAELIARTKQIQVQQSN